MNKIELKRVNHKLSRRAIDAPSAGRFCEAYSGAEKSLVEHGFVKKKKKANLVSRTLLLRGYKLKETKLDRFGKRPEATEAEEIGDQSTEVDVNALRRSIEPFSFSFLYDRVTTLDLHFLL